MIKLADDYEMYKRGWVKENSKQYYDKFRPEWDNSFSTNFNHEDLLTVQTRAEDYAIDQAIRSGEFTPEKPLIISNPYGLTPQCALVGFYTEKPLHARCITHSKPGAKDIVTETEKMQYHRIPVLGLYAGEMTDVCIELLGEEGDIVEDIHFSLWAPELSTNMDGTVHVKKHTRDSAFPLILVSGGSTDYPYAFDENGDIRYFIKVTTKSYGVFPLSGGHFLQQVRYALEPTITNPHGVILRERDWLGRVHRDYYVENGTHHDVQEMTPGGNLLAGYSNLKDSMENSVVEIDRKTGKILKQADLNDLLDEKLKRIPDWIHVNAVSYDPKRKTVLVCSRNLHSVIQINWETGELDWILGHPEFWKGTRVEDKLLKWEDPEMPWFFQAHAAYFLPEDMDGNPDTRQLILFDNHWHKRTPVPFFDETRKGSYGKFYCINDKTRTVSFVKEFEAIKSPIRANAQYVDKMRRVFVMSSYLVKTTEDGLDGMMYEYDYDTGELYNQYGVFHSFFRAYGFFPEFQKSGEAIDYDDSAFELGHTRKPAKVSGIDFSHAKNMHGLSVIQFKKLSQKVKRKLRRKKEKSKEPVRKVRSEFKVKEYKKNGLTNELSKDEILQEIGMISIGRTGFVLGIKARDHLIQHVYLRGESGEVYEQDYSNTEQILPAVFGEMHYTLSIYIKDLPPDIYHIYLDVKGTVYETRWTITRKA